MIAADIPQHEIAPAIGVSLPTLRKTFGDDLKNGRTRTVAKVAAVLVKEALAGNIVAAMFYLKTKGGWKETQKHEHTGEDGKPIEHRVTMTQKDIKELNDAFGDV